MKAEINEVNIPQTAIVFSAETEEDKKVIKELAFQKINQLRASYKDGVMYIIIPYPVMKVVQSEKKPELLVGAVQTDNKFTKKRGQGQG